MAHDLIEERLQDRREAGELPVFSGAEDPAEVALHVSSPSLSYSKGEPSSSPLFLQLALFLCMSEMFLEYSSCTM